MTEWRPTAHGYALPDRLTATGVGGLVLDPMGGSGTTAEACLRTGRRFITITDSADAAELTWIRCQQTLADPETPRQYIPRPGCPQPMHVVWVEAMTHHLHPRATRQGPVWDNGHSYIVTGECAAVMATIPDGVVDLVYADPPFLSQRDYFWASSEKPPRRLAEYPQFWDRVRGTMAYSDKWTGAMPEPPTLIRTWLGVAAATYA